MHRIVGLDLAGEKVRVVALETGFRGFSVLEARSVALPAGGTPGERLKAALAQVPRSEDDTVAVALPGPQVASQVVTLPFTDARRIERVLPAEVEGAIPFDLEDVVWDHAVLSQANGRTEVLVGVVKKSALQQALAQLGEAGVDPRVVTFAPLALATPAERGMVARDGVAEQDGRGATEAVLDAGPDRADFCLLDGGHPVLARSLSSAGLPAWEAARSEPLALDRLLSPLVRDLKMSPDRLVGTAPEALAGAARAIVALAADGSPKDVALSVLGVPPTHIVVPWEDATIAGFALTRSLDGPTRRRIGATIAALWPPGPHALAAAAVKAIESIAGRGRQVVSCFVGPDTKAGTRTRTAALPVRLGAGGVVDVLTPSLSVVERVALENAMAL